MNEQQKNPPEGVKDVEARALSRPVNLKTGGAAAHEGQPVSPTVAKLTNIIKTIEAAEQEFWTTLWTAECLKSLALGAEAVHLRSLLRDARNCAEALANLTRKIESKVTR